MDKDKFDAVLVRFNEKNAAGKHEIVKFVYTDPKLYDSALPIFKKAEKDGKLDIVYAEKNVPLSEIERKFVLAKAGKRVKEVL
jgi:hypothetical protein